MFSLKSLSLLALAGSAVAVPHHRGRPNNGGKVVWETVIKTVYATVEPGQPHPTEVAEPVTSPAAPPAYPTVIPDEGYVVKPKPSSSKVVVITTSKTPTPPAPTSYAPPPPPPASSAPPAPAPSQPASGDYMDVVAEWRAKLGLKALKRSTKLEANALKTVQKGGSEMVHWLGPGSMGQVLAPGQTEDFEHCFVGGWLCEIPSLPGLNGVCSTASNGWDHQQQTGHAEILTDDSYFTIGCACNEKVWACDLGYENP